ncbi:MAG: protease HtpX [Deltaproteobacteria bacterium]|nr:protease HtpX [Deltaproteobacteria bacterium]
MMRIVLFLVTNIAVLAVISVLFSVFGVQNIFAANGVDLDLGKLLVYSAIIGFTGSIISLLLSKTMAKWQTGAKIIPADARDPESQWLVSRVRAHAEAAGIGMPEVAIFPADQPNAFATGARRDAALVAVSTGLLHGMRKNEIDAVLGHEIAHIANGDMVTLTLIQGVVNTFVVFLSRLAGHFVDRVLMRGDRDEESVGHGPAFFITSLVAQIVFGILASMIVAWFSRQREFRADIGGARYAGTENMIAALERLKAGVAPMPDGMKAMGIGNGGMMALFSTHPPLDVRIAALRANRG